MGAEVALMMMVGGAALGLGGAFAGRSAAIQKGEAEASLYGSKAEAADFNALAQRQQGAQERIAAGLEASDLARKGSAKFASGIAARGATGVTEAGSPLMVDEATIREIALGVARTRYAGDIRGQRLEEAATLSEMEARNARKAAAYARQGGYISGDASLLAGLGSTASSLGTGLGGKYGFGRD